MLSQRRRLDARSSAILVCASLLPDLIDKSIYLCGLTHVSRNITHNVGLWVCVTAAWLIATRRRGKGALTELLLAGIWCHLITDFVDDAVGGVCQHGWVMESWFVWPLLHNTSFFILLRGYPEVAASISISPLELISYVGFVLWLMVTAYARVKRTTRANLSRSPHSVD